MTLSDDILINPVRKILHVDMDAYYAAVEIRDNPSLRGLPLVVGGEGRGVVLTASYEARKFGVRSAMPGFKARQLCPNLVFVRPRFDAYVEASNKTREIFARYTDLIEPRSLDEAFLDVTDNHAGKFAVQIAREIKASIKEEVGITCSVGIGQNKLIAKIASDYQKPDGLTVVPPERVLEFMEKLPLRAIPGVGPVTEKWLIKQGYNLCKDVWPKSLEELSAELGERMGLWIYRKSRGIASAPVGGRSEEGRKSIGRQRSIGPGNHSQAVLIENLKEIAEGISSRMLKRDYVGKTITLNLKHTWDKARSRSRTLASPVNNQEAILKTAVELFDLYEDKHIPIRLVGITVSGLEKTLSQVIS